MATTATPATTDGAPAGEVCFRPSDPTALPTHTCTTAKATQDNETPHRRRRRRCCIITLAVTLTTLVLLGVTILVLALTVFRVRDPTTRLVSARVVGFSPNPTQLNVTLLLTVSVHNPNPASFSYSTGGCAALMYRGVRVGDAVVEPGRIPSRGDGAVETEMTMVVSSGLVSADVMAELIKDIEAGAVPFDASARIPGEVAVLFGVVRLRAVAYSDCHVVFGVAEMGIRSQVCHDHAKL